MGTADGLTIADAAERLGLTTDTLRYYEKDGLLLRPVGRTPSGHRRYGPDDLRWIELVTRLRSTGMAIRDVRRYADLVRDGAGNEFGVCTSGGPSPTLGKSIGLGYVPAASSAIGSELLVDCRGKKIPARIVKTPFYKRK